MPASDKRIAANRANAEHSTGPRTPEGMEKSKMNAVAHGLTAQTAVLPGEDPGQLELLSQSLMRQLHPRGMLQRLVAERIVSLAWKLRRVARAEESVAREMKRRPRNERPRPGPGRADGSEFLAESIRDKGELTLFESADTRLTRLTQYELKLDAALRAAIREMRALQDDDNFVVDPEDEAPVESAETAREQNEPIATPDEPRAQEGECHEPTAAPDRQVGNREGAAEGVGADPGLGCTAPLARGEAPAGETNPSSGAEAPAQDEEEPRVTPGPGPDSSAPVPGTSSSPPPGPRR